MDLGRDYWTTRAIWIDRFHQQVDVLSNKTISDYAEPRTILVTIFSGLYRLKIRTIALFERK
jgi:hypothetical protein